MERSQSLESNASRDSSGGIVLVQVAEISEVNIENDSTQWWISQRQRTEYKNKLMWRFQLPIDRFCTEAETLVTPSKPCDIPAVMLLLYLRFQGDPHPYPPQAWMVIPVHLSCQASLWGSKKLDKKLRSIILPSMTTRHKSHSGKRLVT